MLYLYFGTGTNSTSVLKCENINILLMLMLSVKKIQTLLKGTSLVRNKSCIFASSAQILPAGAVTSLLYKFLPLPPHSLHCCGNHQGLHWNDMDGCFLNQTWRINNSVQTWTAVTALTAFPPVSSTLIPSNSWCESQVINLWSEYKTLIVDVSVWYVQHTQMWIYR